MAKKTTRTTPAPDTTAPAKPRTRAKASAPRTRKATAKDKSVATDVESDTIVVTRETTIVVVTQEPTEEDIRVRAYHRYLERGGVDGSEFDDWLEARRDLLKAR